jgi:acetylornithine deacetylase/succinyl-diaminopimelate desuccinylase-like protein
MNTPTEPNTFVAGLVQPARLLQIAERLIAVPSRTGEAGAVLDTLADFLRTEGFLVHRPPGGHPAAPAVAVWLDSGTPGPTLQWNGHLDTVHLPFVPPAVREGFLTGSGAADMKGGLAAALEALLALRDGGVLSRGRVLLTAHDLHEAPWGRGEQLDELIRRGLHGDAVLIPEPLCDYLPVVGRGAATWKAIIKRNGIAVHEVMRPSDEPDVIAAGADLVARLAEFQALLNSRSDPHAGHETVFIGQIHSGEIYNQYPRECWLEGTRRWLPGTSRQEVETEFRQLLEQLAQESGTQIETEFRTIRDPFRLSPTDPLVTAFQMAYAEQQGEPLPLAAKPFVDDGNSFYGLGPIPAITHGPRAGGQHTIAEWVEIADLVRVAQLYARTAVLFTEHPPPPAG